MRRVRQCLGKSTQPKEVGSKWCKLPRCSLFSLVFRPFGALSSLTRRDADAVRATVRAAASSHTVQEHDDYDGYLSLLDHTGERDPVFFHGRRSDGARWKWPSCGPTRW